MKRIEPLIILLLFSLEAFCQLDKPQLAVRTSLQSDLQKAAFKETKFPFEFKQHSALQINWGLDVLKEKEIAKNWYAFIGAGYFRNRFNFKRFYDHQLLNPVGDSILIGTITKNYTYNLIRLPFGISYQLRKKDNHAFSLGIENDINFSFSQVYNGGKPFPEANNKLSKFDYYGNSVLLFARITTDIFKTKHLQIEPYIRIVNTYRREDPIVEEINIKPITKAFDAIGLSIKLATSF